MSIGPTKQQLLEFDARRVPREMVFDSRRFRQRFDDFVIGNVLIT